MKRGFMLLLGLTLLLTLCSCGQSKQKSAREELESFTESNRRLAEKVENDRNKMVNDMNEFQKLTK